jgi:hypothetical protein
MELDSRRGVFLVLLDVSAAFNTIDHKVLLSLMKGRLGLDGTVLDWFQSYLSNRSQKTCIGKSMSHLFYLLFGVPQGSVLGPVLFNIYILPIGDIARRHGISFHIYADDTQIYCSFDLSQADDARQRIECCIDEIRQWMISNKLKLNDDKTEVIVLSAAQHHHRVQCNRIVIGNADIAPHKSARNLGVIFDQHLSMDAHIKLVCRNAYYYLRNISSIRRVLSVESAKALVHAFITSRLDYCNSLFYGLPQQSIARLQRVQNMAARMITGTKMRDEITPVLISLHWLPIHQRIIFKILMLTFKAQHDQAPQYLKNILSTYQPPRSLRSTTKCLLNIPRMSLKRYGYRAFCHAAPLLWNDLPLNIRSGHELATFKSALKTHLFTNYYT